jgi:hypothetical protein
MNGASAQRSQVSDHPSTIPCDNSGNAPSGAGGGEGATARALFVAPELSHSSSLPARSVFGRSPAPDAEQSEAASSMSPTSVLDAAASFASGPDVIDGKRRPWSEGLRGLADALDCADVRQPSLVRSHFFLRPLRGGGRELATSPASVASSEPEETEVMEPSSEDYTCVICHGPNPRTVHIFGDRVVEGGAETSPRPINLPARGDDGAFLSL